MFKNAVIALLLSTILFMIEPYTELLNVFAFLSVASVAFFIVCAIEDAYERYTSMMRRFKRFKREVNKITLNRPTKAC